MAFVQTPIPDNEQNKQAPAGQTTPNPLSQLPPEGTSTGGSAGQGGGSAGNGAAPSVGSSTQFGSSASKLSDYLSANAPQIQSMGNDIAGTLTQNYGQIQNAVDTAAQGFGQAVNAGYAAPDSALVNQAATDPTGFAKSPDNVKAFQAQYNDQYTGPQNFESTSPYSDVQGQVNQAVQGAGLLGTHAGLSSYLQRNVEKNPTPGQNTLDTVLLESQPEAIKAVSDAAKPFAGLTDYLANSAKTQNALVAPAQQAAQKASSDTRNAFTGPNGVVPTFANALNKNYSNAVQPTADYNNELNDIAGKIANNNYAGLTPEEKDLIGYNNAETTTISQYPTIFPNQAAANPINFSNYFTQGPQAKTPQPSDVITPDQIAEYQALQTLTGQTPGVNFSMPDQSTGNGYGMPTSAPEYNNFQALTAIQQAYQPFFDQIPQSSITPEMQNYMTTLSQLLNAPQPAPQPINTQPAIPLQPPTAPPPGSGHYAF